jgi:probable HAF family extracellular repeat protein
MNDVGQIAGTSWISNNSSYLNFVYNFQDQSFTKLNTPAGSITFSNAINDDGTVVGYTLLVARTVGFEYSLNSEKFKLILPVNVAFAEPFGITARGQVVGEVVLHNGQFSDSVVFEGGQYRILNIPGAQQKVLGVNPAGTAYVGTYGENMFDGFIYADKILTTLQFPGAIDTSANGVNNAGQVVGYFIDASGNTHGFLYSPSSEQTGN